MFRRPSLALLALLLSSSAATAQAPAEPRARPTRPAGQATGWHAFGSGGAVVAGGSEAVDAGIAVLRDGGNAADAAVATILALGATDAGAFCLGGEVPILAYDARRRVVEVVAGQGAAPRLATRAHFLQTGRIPRSGVESAAVPAAIDACLTALGRHGTMTFTHVAAPTLRILDRHEQPWHADLARTLRALAEAEARSPDRLRGLRLAADAFYRGDVARRIDAWSRARGGLLRYPDLAAHVSRIEEPASASYRGYTVVKCGPWTQGPALLEALQILDGSDLKALGPGRPAAIHLEVEALKLAFADRDAYYADPLFRPVPLAQLLAPSYAALRRSLVDPRRASLTLRPGDPESGRALRTDPDPRHGPPGVAFDTTTCLAADRWGNVVAATPSGWSGVLAGDTGIWLGSRLQSFNLWDGHPNVIEPGKRPRITLTPTIVLRADRPAFAVSVAGGDAQDQVTLQVLVNLIDFGMTPADAVSAPRFTTDHLVGSFGQAEPRLGSLTINPGVGDETIAELTARGHRVTVSKAAQAAPSALRLDPSGRIDAAGDPRAGRHAAAY